MARYTKAEIVAHVAEAAGIKKSEAEKALDSFFELVTNQAKEGSKVAWAGFGSFSATQRAARTGRNPHTGAEIQIAATTAMKFTPAKALKEALNN